MARLDMTLAVVGTLSTNKLSNQQKDKKHTQFQHDAYEITRLSTIMGSGWVNFIESEAQNGFQGSEKRNTSLSYQKTPNRSNKDKNLFQQEIPT